MANGWTGVFDLLKTHAKEARIGASLGLTGSFSFLFIDAHHAYGFWDLVIKLLFMCISTACTAIIGAWGKDAYDNLKEYRKKKEKNNERKRSNSRSGGSKAA